MYKKLSLFVFLFSSLLNSEDKITPISDLRVPEGLEIREFAASPMIYSPVAMDVDLEGRLWVVEDLNNSNLRTKEKYSQISILEDVDQDGKADKKTLFGPSFSSIVMGIAVFDNVIVVSMAPEIIVYTDVNRNLVYDEGVDKKDVILKGFYGHSHDHALHAVVPGPDGRWYFSHGNKGLAVKTMDGKEFYATSYYSDNRVQDTGKKSSDGHLYIGGVGMSVKPDGSQLDVEFHNTRNTHDLFVSSFGDVIHGDNDDPAHARAAWAMKYANYGYASLEDGSRSWEDSAKSWEEKVVQSNRRGEGKLRLNEGHWRQNVPGTVQPGVQWGAGAPTGCTFIEGDELGAQFRGSFLLCETVNQSVFSFKTGLENSDVHLRKNEVSMLSVAPDVESDLLLSDVVQSLDGSLYVSDWNSSNNRRGRGDEKGAIYLISKKGKNNFAIPEIDLKTTKGALKALTNPANNVRWLAAEFLKQQNDCTNQLIEFYNTENNPYIQARVIWILAHKKDDVSLNFVENLISAENPNLRITTLRVLLQENPGKRFEYLSRLSKDNHSAVRREVAVRLRDLDFDKVKVLIKNLIQGFDGKDKTYLEALGQASKGKEERVYQDMVKPEFPNIKDWKTDQALLAWRLQSKSSLKDLEQYFHKTILDIETFRLLITGFSLTETVEKRAENTKRLMGIKKLPQYSGEEYQQTIQEILEKDVLDKKPVALTGDYVFPASYGSKTNLASVEEIAKLKPNRQNGQVKSAICLTCHTIGQVGISFGPNLSQWGQTRNISVIIDNIVNPASELAHGYEKAVVLTNKTHKMEGIDMGYSYHAGAIRVKTIGGQMHKIGFRQNRVKIERLNHHSWMPSASKLGLSNQDVRDIAEYLKTFAE